MPPHLATPPNKLKEQPETDDSVGLEDQPTMKLKKKKGTSCSTCMPSSPLTRGEKTLARAWRVQGNCDLPGGKGGTMAQVMMEEDISAIVTAPASAHARARPGPRVSYLPTA